MEIRPTITRTFGGLVDRCIGSYPLMIGDFMVRCCLEAMGGVRSGGCLAAVILAVSYRKSRDA